MTSSGIVQTNFVSVDLADLTTSATPDTEVLAIPTVTAVRGNHVFSTTINPATSTAVYILSAFTAEWLAVDLNIAGSAVAALTNGSFFAGTATLTIPGSFVNINITSGNRYSTSNFVDLALVNTVANGNPLTAVVSGFAGNGIAAADMGNGVGTALTWTPVPQSNGLSLVGLAVAANGTRQAAYETSSSVNKVYVSNDGGVTWVLSLTLTAGNAAIKILDIACDATCTTIAVVYNPDAAGTAEDLVYISRNGGASWGAGVTPGKTSSVTGATTLISAAVNAEGTVIYAAASGTVAPNGQIWAINTAGVSEARATGDWLTIDAGSGGVLAGSKATGQVFLSLDGGVTMPSSGGPFTNVWNLVDVSSDGSKIAVAGVAGATAGTSSQVYTGVCTGTACTYTQQLPTVSGTTLPNDKIVALALSGEGSRLLVGFKAIANGGIWSAASTSGNDWTWKGPNPVGVTFTSNDYVGLGISSNGGIATAIGGGNSATAYGFLQGAGP